MALQNGDINLGQNFQPNFGRALDARNQQPSVADRNLIPSNKRFIGMLCYTVAEDTLWVLKGGILDSNWVKVGGSITPYTRNTAYKAGDFVYCNFNSYYIVFFVPSDFTSQNLSTVILSAINDSNNNRIIYQSGSEKYFTQNGTYLKGTIIYDSLNIYECINAYTNSNNNTATVDVTNGNLRLLSYDVKEFFVSSLKLDNNNLCLSTVTFTNKQCNLNLGVRGQESYDNNYFYKCLITYDSINNIPAVWIRTAIS